MIEGLSELQSIAAEAIEGPVLVYAGAGSGKTRTLTFRILHMIVNCKINPSNILAITFTNKATNVMKDRLKQYKDVDFGKVTISTFHSLCAMILRKDIHHLGYKNDFNIIDEDEQVKVVGEVLESIGYPKKEEKYYSKVINKAKCFDYIPKIPKEQEIYLKYEEKMKELNMLDFEDLLIKVYELFETQNDILQKYQNKYKYILVDEFQDTNLIQYKILRLLALGNQNLFLVGDDDQSIYSFRGTNYENIQLFKDDFPFFRSYLLNENYRSTQTILDYANRLIANNVDREKKSMFSNIEGSSDDVVFKCLTDQYAEVNYVVSTIKKLKNDMNSYTDFAILYRSSVIMRNFERPLIENEIPYKVYGGVSYLRRKEVKDIASFFRLMINPFDHLSFNRIVNVPSRGIGLVTIKKILEIQKTYHLSIFDAIDYSSEILNRNKYEQLKNFKDMIVKYQNRLETDSLINIFNDLIEEIKYVEYLKEEYDEENAKERIDNLMEFKSILYTAEATSNTLSPIIKLVEALDSQILDDDSLQSQKENKNGVTVSTIHSVKGLEFKYVFLVGMEENVFPNFSRVENDFELEEERRIAYVAMTRAKDKLFLTHAKKRLLFGHTYSNEPSRFLIEASPYNSKDEYLDCEVVKDFEKIPMKRSTFNSSHYNDLDYACVNTAKVKEGTFIVVKEAINQDKENDSLDYAVGDKINHTKFGEGIILMINDNKADIFFTNEKVKKTLQLNHPSISKL